MLPQNRVILTALLQRLKWKRVSQVKPKHVLKSQFSIAYTKSVESIPERYAISGASTNQAALPLLNAALVGEDDENFMLDLLWAGKTNPKLLSPACLTHFRVIFNGLDNIADVINMRTLRDQLFQVRSAILMKT